MKVYAVNGSPRKNSNTATLLKKALEGVKSSDKEIETEIINLYDYNYKGCISCFACKLNDGESYGKCAVKDDLKEILEKLSQADGIIFGSPIYIHGISSQIKALLERLIFAYLSYDDVGKSLAPKQMPTAFIYTMGMPENMMQKVDYPNSFNKHEELIEVVFSKPEVMYSNDTYQFNDYSKYKVGVFSEKEKAKQRKIQFPLDCNKSFEIGANLIK